MNMVRDSEDEIKNEESISKCATSALMRRNEQLKRWEESETNRIIPATKYFPKRVRFPEQCVFLAACSCGDLDEVATLLENGADVNTTNVDGMTALHQAVIDENSEMVEYLIEHGADIDAQDNEGWSPLMAGVSCNFLEIVRFLLKSGADPVLCNSDRELPVDLAESDEMRAILQLEISNRGICLEEARFHEEKIMLEDALAWSKASRISNEHRHHVTGATPTHVAAAKGYCKVLRILLQAGADPNAKDNDGWTPIHAATHWGEREACEILMEHGANMDLQNNMTLTCLDVAEPDLVPFLESLKEKKKQTANLTNQKRSVQPIAPCTSTSEPVTPMSPQGLHLPAWRLTGRRASSTGSLPTAPAESSSAGQQKSGEDAKSVSEEGASPAKKRASGPVVASNPVPLSDEKNRLSNGAPRGEESEAERKLRARRERESRRSTQGITLETIKAAENVLASNDHKKRSVVDGQELKECKKMGDAKRVDSVEATKETSNESLAKQVTSLARLSANLNSTLRNYDEFIATPATTNVTLQHREKDKFSATFIPSLDQSSIKEAESKTTSTNQIEATASSSGLTQMSAAKCSTPSNAETNGPPSTARNRRARGNRRSTGPIAQDDVHSAAGDSASATPAGEQQRPAPDKENENSQRQLTTSEMTSHAVVIPNADLSQNSRYTSKPIFAYTNLSDYRNNRSPAYLSNVTNSCSSGNNGNHATTNCVTDRFSRTSSGVSVSSSSDADVDYKKMYERESNENERLRKIIADLEKSLESVKFTSKHSSASGDGSHIVPYNSRLEQLVAKLEEENRTLDQIKSDNVRLKEENGALIRVISKLSKTK